MKIAPEANCPLDSFNPCRQLKCAWFTQIRGIDPNSGKEIDDWGCAMAWLPMLMIENAMQSRQTGAAVESFRNEMVKVNKETLALGAASIMVRQLTQEK